MCLSINLAGVLLVFSNRKQLAHLCGFETYSHRANLNTIMETPEKIMEFLGECSSSIAGKADADFNLMRQFKRNTLKSNEPLMPWDVPLISNRIKKQMFDLDRLQYMSYFSLGCCMEGLNIILNNLYK
jgi:Zn-dependent oligopeptidase